MQRDMEVAAAAGVEEADDAPIAAFAVSKGGVVVKHIFLNAPPPEMTRTGDGKDPEEDPPVTVGRHPDCHVLVDHPSVSRFHLELRARRRQRRITVTDLSSVHGTWVSGRRIPPNKPVDLAAGDTLRLGASRREYRLLWLSLREALQMEDPLPPLIEEDKEDIRTCQESSNQLVPGHKDLVGTNTQKDTCQKVVSGNNAFLDAAPPLPEFVQSFYQEHSALSEFSQNGDDVTKKKLVDKSSVSESCGSLIIKDKPATVTNVGTPVQAAKKYTSSQVFKRAKLKSVKSLRIDTGRNRDRSSTSSQKEDQNDILVCSQICGIQCAACIALLGISEFEGTYQKNKMTEEVKGHMNPPASITMEANKKEPTNRESYIPQDLVDDKSERSISLLHPVELSEPVSENTSAPEVKLNDFSTANFDGSVLNIENIAPYKIAEGPTDSELQELRDNEEISPLDLENITPYVSENTATDSELQEFQDNEEISPLGKDNMFPYVSENTTISDVKLSVLSTLLERGVSNSENLVSNEIAEGSKDCLLEGTICGNLFGDSGAEVFQDNEEISVQYKENITPYVSGNIVMESNRGLKPTFSQELMDSISPLHLEHDTISGKESSILNIGNEMKSNEPSSENLSPLISADTKLQENQVEFMPISHLEFKDDILSDSEKSVLAPGKYDAISPVTHEDLFSDKENVTPVSRDRKPNVRRVLGAKMDDSVSVEKTSNIGNHIRGSNELSTKFKDFRTAKSKDFHTVEDDVFYSVAKDIHTVDDGVFYSDKENMTPTPSRGMKTRKGLPKNVSVDALQDHEAFVSDKENSSPLSSATQNARDMSENRTRIESVIRKKRVADRLPFQTLLSYSPSKPTSSVGCNCAVNRAAAGAGGYHMGIKLEDEMDNVSHYLQESGRTEKWMKAWTMVADADSLLDDESRKSIMLLKGIKGTHLIIPRIVIRELNSMKQKEGLFRRSSKATSILQWIDECMENESWWVHVQSTSEMLPVAPTPPATPSAQCIDEEIKISSGSFNPMAMFSPRSFSDITSPKPEDRVLDCALHFRKLRSDQNMVILSNSITLKIKAMAEGLLCEGAKEFRESLMNPCSDRFMWAASMPRGSAWSCLDETTLAQNYYNSHHHELKRTPRTVEAAKGLKLILRHNSLFAQATNPARKTPLASLVSV